MLGSGFEIIDDSWQSVLKGNRGLPVEGAAGQVDVGSSAGWIVLWHGFIDDFGI